MCKNDKYVKNSNSEIIINKLNQYSKKKTVK